MARRPELGIAREVVGTVAGLLVDLGYSRAAMLRASSESVVPGSSADELLEAASKDLKLEALGIELGRRLPLGSLGILDYALCSAPTVREGLRRLTRYYGIVTQRVSLKLEDDAGQSRLVFTRDEAVQHSRHWIEFSFAAICERIRQTAGPKVRFDEVRFRHAAPVNRAAHDNFFGTRAEFGAATDTIGFSNAILDLPLRTAAAALGSVLEARMKELEPERAATDAFIDSVRRAVVELLDKEDPQLESVVARLGTARRTLQRELQNRGTSHKQILDEVRRERALQLLEEPNLTVTEVAYRLGFSKPSAFFRAFRRWTGKSPKAAVAVRQS